MSEAYFDLAYAFWIVVALLFFEFVAVQLDNRYKWFSKHFKKA